MAALQSQQCPNNERHFFIQATSSPKSTYVVNYHMVVNNSNLQCSHNRQLNQLSRNTSVNGVIDGGWQLRYSTKWRSNEAINREAYYIFLLTYSRTETLLQVTTKQIQVDILGVMTMNGNSSASGCLPTFKINLIPLNSPPWTMLQRVPLERWYPPSRLYGVAIQKTII